jgi:hypothetical protein
MKVTFTADRFLDCSSFLSFSYYSMGLPRTEKYYKNSLGVTYFKAFSFTRTSTSSKVYVTPSSAPFLMKVNFSISYSRCILI